MSDKDDCLDEELRVQGQPRLHRGCALLVEGPRKQVSGGVGRGSADCLRLYATSVAAERVFSLLKFVFGDQATTALVDYIQTAIMLRRSNKRKKSLLRSTARSLVRGACV
jgi:hypothetical protein